METDDYDTPWKEVVTHHFPDFMAFYFPFAYAAIDWPHPHAFLDQEFATLSTWALNFVDATTLDEVFDGK